MDKPILMTLNVKATDNHGHEYGVTLRDGAGFGRSPIVSIDGTPGKWFMSTLIAHRDNRLSIDYGQGWYCTNWNEIAEEISHSFY